MVQVICYTCRSITPRKSLIKAHVGPEQSIKQNHVKIYRPSAPYNSKLKDSKVEAFSSVAPLGD